MTLDPDALWFLLVGAAIVGAIRMLIGRMAGIDQTLNSHGRQLVRIETKLGITNDHDAA